MQYVKEIWQLVLGYVGLPGTEETRRCQLKDLEHFHLFDGDDNSNGVILCAEEPDAEAMQFSYKFVKDGVEIQEDAIIFCWSFWENKVHKELDEFFRRFPDGESSRYNMTKLKQWWKV